MTFSSSGKGHRQFSAWNALGTPEPAGISCCSLGPWGWGSRWLWLWVELDTGKTLAFFWWFSFPLSWHTHKLSLDCDSWPALTLLCLCYQECKYTAGQTHVLWQLCNPATFQLSWWHLDLIGRLAVSLLSLGTEQAGCPNPSCEQWETIFLLACWWNLGDSASGRHGSLDTWGTYCIWYFHDTCTFLKNTLLYWRIDKALAILESRTKAL